MTTDVCIVIDLNSAPVISNKVSTVQTISENAPVNTTIYQYLVTDSDAGDTHMWTATYNPTSGINYFTIDSGTGLVKTSGAIDFEALAATSFTVTVIVTDGQASDTTTLSITVDNVNESPTFPKTSYVLNTVESAAGASIGNPNFAASDPDSSTTLTYSTTCSTVSIDSSIGSASFTSAYDLDVVGTATNITCPITVSDGSLSVSTSLLITITNINDNTPTFGSSAYTFIVISTTAVNTVIGSIAATDGDIGTYGTLTYELDQISLGNEYFAVSSTGDLSIKTSISSFAIGAVYSLTATVTDGGGLNDTAPITIIIPSTTTTTYVTSDRPITFFEDNRNIAWFTVVMIVAAITGALITYMIVKYVWLFKNKYVPQKQIPEPEKNKGIKEGKWKPWKIWEQNRY